MGEQRLTQPPYSAQQELRIILYVMTLVQSGIKVYFEFEVLI